MKENNEALKVIMGGTEGVVLKISELTYKVNIGNHEKLVTLPNENLNDGFEPHEIAMGLMIDYMNCNGDV